jgi:hypothetical protein
MVELASRRSYGHAAFRDMVACPKEILFETDDTPEATMVLISHRYGLRGRSDAIVNSRAAFRILSSLIGQSQLGQCEENPVVAVQHIAEGRELS